MVNKKAQMKIQQMSFMLIAVFMFFALVGMIVVTIMMSNIQSSATALKEQNAKLMASRIANSPEFSCGEAYSGKTDCIDLDKVMALKENVDKYAKFWGVDNIEIRRLYPSTVPYKEIACTFDSYPRYRNGTACNYIKLMDKPITGNDHPNYVALCRKEKYKDETVNKCEMGQIILRYGEAGTK